MLPVASITREKLTEFLDSDCVSRVSGKMPDGEAFRLTMDSRDAKNESVFFAVDGTQKRGKDFISNALENACRIVILDDTQFDDVQHFLEQRSELTFVGVENLKSQIGAIATFLFDTQEASIKICGVTGTNGKTTVTSLLSQACVSLDVDHASIGTLGFSINGGQPAYFGLTTPDVLTLHGLVAYCEALGLKSLFMEVSSHSIDQGRVHGLRFDTVVFTNLSQDHLDYHGDMDTYGAVKSGWILGANARHAIVNAGDAFGKKIIETGQREATFDPASLLSFSAFDADADCSLIKKDESRVEHADGMLSFGEGVLRFQSQAQKMRIALAGDFNLSNIAAVASVLLVNDFTLEAVAKALESLSPVEGRLELVSGAQDNILTIVDFAHTPDALQKTLLTAKALTKGELIAVYGCGGDRDKTKRSPMMKAGIELAHHIFVTSDNPRTENPDAIIQDMLDGLTRADLQKVTTCPNRSDAIKKAIIGAQKDDCVVIAGKGHEKFQLINDTKIPFSDQLVAKSCLAERTRMEQALC